MSTAPKLTALLLIAFLVFNNHAYSQATQPTLRELDSIYALNALPLRQLQTPKPYFTQPRPYLKTVKKHPAKPILTSIKKRSQKSIAANSTLSLQTAICFDTSARFFVINDTLAFYAAQPSQVADGNLLIPGEAVVTKPPYNVSFGFLMKCTLDGTILWTKTYDSANHKKFHYINYYKTLELKDGSLLLAGGVNNSTTENDDLILTHTDASGNIIWSKTYKSRFWQNGNGSADYYYVQQMKQDPFEGAIYLCGPLWGGGRTLIKLDVTTGALLWSNSYEVGANFDHPFGIDIRRDEIRYFGEADDTYADYVSVYRINKTTGKVKQVKNFRSDYPIKFATDFLSQDPLTILNNGNYALSGECLGYWQWNWDGTTPLHQAAVLELDSNLNFVRAYCFRNAVASNSHNTRVTVFPDGSGIFTMLKFYSGYTADVYYVQFRDGQIVKSRKRLYGGEGIPIENPALRLADGGDLMVKLLGDSSTNIPKIEFLKLHASDTASTCLGLDDYATTIMPFTYSERTPIPIDSIGYNAFMETTNQTIAIQQTTATRYPACFQVSHCDSLKLLASDSVLCISKTLQLTIRKNAACGSLVPLTYAADVLDTLIQLTDSTMSFKFKKPWAGYIAGSLQGCTLMQDSVYVRILDIPGKLNLGPDTSICPSNSLVLNAHSGYATYRWQDGSSDSLFIVTEPGTYHLKVTDACGGIFFDTVRVALRTPSPLSIGADRVKCNADTIHLQATGGFLNYTWSPNYHVSDRTKPWITVNPLVDTFYTVKAEKTPGCFAYDTVRIHVLHSPGIQLGSDTSFCSRQSIVLDAGTGFNSYRWNTGETTQHITVQQPGQYTLNATTMDGCHSYDTLVVQSVYQLPEVHLNNDPGLCIGTSHLLDAGLFSTYLWQDGSTRRTFRAATIGVYTIEVTDPHGCKGRDTARITTLLPIPAHFLAPDTAICSYGTLQLQPLKSFSAYLWSTNSTQPHILISHPGMYSLQVTDSNHCVGTDSIIVHDKQCLTGLYVPTAFTPNNDGKNDQLQALLFGAIKEFEFSIYNRWGQLVFKTKDTSKGWNGEVKQVKQNSGAYVWTCRYQLAGEPEKFEKGTIVLIR